MKSEEKDQREQSIDEKLKRVFEQTLDEGIPDRFRDLLSQLKQQDRDLGPAK